MTQWAGFCTPDICQETRICSLVADGHTCVWKRHFDELYALEGPVTTFKHGTIALYKSRTNDQIIKAKRYR